MGGQLSTFNDSTYVGNEDLCGVPLPECPGDEANHCTSHEEDNDKLERVLDYAFIVMVFIVGFWTYLGIIFMKESALLNSGWWTILMIGFMCNVSLKLARA